MHITKAWCWDRGSAEGEPPTHGADIMSTGLPSTWASFQEVATAELAKKDKAMHDRLEKAGFKLNRSAVSL